MHQMGVKVSLMSIHLNQCNGLNNYCNREKIFNLLYFCHLTFNEFFPQLTKEALLACNAFTSLHWMLLRAAIIEVW